MKHFTVYNAEFFFVASSNPKAWLVKRYKLKSKKIVLWDTLLNIQEVVSYCEFWGLEILNFSTIAELITSGDTFCLLNDHCQPSNWTNLKVDSIL